MSSQPILLPEHEVHLWYYQTHKFSGISEETAFTYLDDAELLRYKRFLCPLRRRQFLTARVMLKQLLSRYSGKEAEEIRLKYSPRQKPFSEGNPAFSISHSGTHLLIGVARHAVGVDIQEEAGIEEEHVFKGLSFQEQQKVSREELFPYWVLKEALWKAGNEEVQLARLLDAIPSGPGGMKDSLSFLPDSWSISYLRLLPDLHAAWAVDYPKPVMRIKRMH